MDIVVVLALLVLVVVFLFSLWMLLVACQRRRQYNRLVESQTMIRFSKLRQTELDDVGALGPHISQALDRNQWINDMATGLIQHCVGVLKLCHQMIEQMAKIQSDHQQQNQQNQPERPPIPPELNELICRATGRVMPRFEALLRSMAAPDVDIRVLEARVGALVSACWALVAPFAVASPEWKGQLEELIGQMDTHLQALQLALDEFEEDQQQERQLKIAKANATLTQQQNQLAQNHVEHNQQQPSTSTQVMRNGQKPTVVVGRTADLAMVDGQVVKEVVNMNNKPVRTEAVSLRIEAEDQPTTSLLPNSQETAVEITTISASEEIT